MIFSLPLILSQQLILNGIESTKEVKKQSLLSKLDGWLSQQEKEDDLAVMEALLEEIEQENGVIPEEWLEMESGPSRVLRVNKPSQGLIKQVHVFNFDVWHLSYDYIDVLVTYEDFQLIVDLISELSPASQFQVLVTDVDEMISELGQGPEQFRVKSEYFKFDPTTWFNEYHSYEDIMALFDGWTKEHKDVMGKEKMGYSFEKRVINAYHIKPFAEYKGDRKRIYIQSLVHAREWYY